MPKDNTILWIGGAFALGAIWYLSKGSTGGYGERTATLPVPYPNGAPRKLKESEFAQYGYLVENDNKIYHSSQYPPPATATGGASVNWQQWAATLQDLVNQGMTAYNAVNAAVAPTINVMPYWATSSAQLSVKVAFNQKTETITKGLNLGGQINNNAYYEVEASGDTTTITIKKLADDSVLATKNINWTAQSVT